jgi:PAS domain S-box-containing protein
MNRLPAMVPAGTDTAREIPFAAEDLIYSRTDPRGVILAANPMFIQLSGYSAEEILNAPHKIVRHPDMPKGFFHIFWSLLKSEEPALGYVKNRSKDGRYYWVLANAISCGDGYFSVRIKPFSQLFGLIRAEYASLIIREQEENLSAEASAEILLGRLATHGFKSYMEFMSQVASEEARARSTALAQGEQREDGKIAALVDKLVEAQAEQDRLVARFSDLMLLPVNMRLVAARLEPQGGPISQISMNYKTASDEITGRLSSFVTGEANLCKQMANAVRLSLVMNGCARLQSELVRTYAGPEGQGAGQQGAAEGAILKRVEDLCISRATDSLAEAGRLAVNLTEASNDVRRMVLGLDTIRILGRVESRRDLLSESSMSATIDQIDKVQGEISDSLKHLTDLTAEIHVSLASMRRPSAVQIAAE